MELLEFFPKCLEEACAFRPVVLILDSLDQLPADEGGRRLDWLPGKIPDDCYLIMSTLPGSEYECLPHLKVEIALLFLRIIHGKYQRNTAKALNYPFLQNFAYF